MLLSLYFKRDFEDEVRMATQRWGDLKMIPGQNLAIGYEGHNQNKAKIYFTESLTFGVFEPEALISCMVSELSCLGR